MKKQIREDKGIQEIGECKKAGGMNTKETFF
jgi:hypothetical protein